MPNPDLVVSVPPQWDESRWKRILDRMEVRLDGIGLRFWGPPLWLEVTMSGPDSDRWVLDDPLGPFRSWDWQSSEACAAAGPLERAGRPDQELLEVAARYTLENLVLNAAHEVGEWLRFDGQRVLPPHDGAGDGHQGNGRAEVRIDFARSSRLDPHFVGPPGPAAPAQTSVLAQDIRLSQSLALMADLGRSFASWRFAYLPGHVISYTALGPALQASGDPGVSWTRPWSAVADLAAAAASDSAGAMLPALPEVPAVAKAIQADVHAMLVSYEAARLCDAFYVDGVRPWRLESGGTPISASGTADAPVDGRQLIGVVVSWSPAP